MTYHKSKIELHFQENDNQYGGMEIPTLGDNKQKGRDSSLGTIGL